MLEREDFTFLELLISISIIAILALVMLPYLKSNKEVANNIASKMYLRNCIVSLEIIRTDSTGVFNIILANYEDNLLGSGKLSRSESIKSSHISIADDRISYLIAIVSVGGAIFKYDGITMTP